MLNMIELPCHPTGKDLADGSQQYLHSGKDGSSCANLSDHRQLDGGHRIARVFLHLHTLRGETDKTVDLSVYLLAPRRECTQEE